MGQSTELLEACLRARGWVRVSLSDSMSELVDALLRSSDELFASKTDTNAWQGYGYTRNEARRSAAVRTLSGRFCEVLPLPRAVRRSVQSLCAAMDKIMPLFLEKSCQTVLGHPFSDLISSELIPLVSQADHRNRFGMLDVASYLPVATETVAEHIDPGLFALSFKSTTLGLELLDLVTKTWIPIEPSQSILWCGSTAAELSNGVIPGGVHRIVVPHEQVTPRLTAWYEICARDQVPASLLESYRLPVAERPKTIDRKVEMINIFMKTLTGKTVPLNVNLYGTIYELKEKVQDKEGIPPSKLRLIFAAPKEEGQQSAKVSQLEEEELVCSYGMKEGSVIHAVLSLRRPSPEKTLEPEAN